MKTLVLGLMLFLVWMIWSGHSEPFLISLGVLSCTFCALISWRMRIIDSESVPVQLGIRPFTRYTPWLIKQIIDANIDVAGRIVRRDMPICPNVVDLKLSQRSDIGRVIMANSITLTPGTVSVDLREEGVRVHALTLEAAAEDKLGDMDRRVTDLESGT